MKLHHALPPVALLLASSIAAHAFAQARLFQAPLACDRACLIKTANDYLAAVVAHDPSDVKLAADLKFVENTERLKAGGGLWKTASAVPSAFALHVPDPVSGQIGFIGMMEESGKPIQLGLRLKVENGAITEAEHLVVRSFNGSSLDNLKTPRPGLLTEIPPAQRAPREVLLAIGMTYYDSIEQSSGDATPFADDCERRENGMITAGGTGNGIDGQPRLGCHAQMDSRTFTYIDSIDFRRVWIADPVTGLVFGLSQFRHSMKDKQITVIGRDGKPTTRDVAFNPFDLPAAHIFKIRDNRIHEIEALGFMTPYMSKGGWSDFAR
ncbi:MAG TPA: hypothetical protein VGL98_01840 [Gammaproteobacteria bacterium]